MYNEEKTKGELCMGRFCRNCGKELQGDEKFCRNCGAKVDFENFMNQSQQLNAGQQVANQQNIQGNVKKPKGKMGCLIIVIVIFAIIGLLIAIGGTSNQQSSTNNNSSSYKSQEDIVAETLNVDSEVAGNIVSVLNNCEVKTITSIEHDEMLDNMNKENEKGYRVSATEVDNVILYLNPDNTINIIRWADEDLYSNGAQVATISQIKNRPDLEVLSHSTESDGYLRYIVGEIRNNTDKTYSYVQVEIGLYNGESLVGSTLDNVNNLEPGQVWQFKALVYEDNATSYKITDVSGL